MRTAIAALTVMLTTGLLLATAALPALATTYIVDPGSGGDFDTIQEAVDVVVDGDIVQVVAGTYTGTGNRDIQYWGANFVLESESGAGVTIIDNQGESGHRLFNITGATFDTTCVIRGFTIQGGRLEGNAHGAGIHLGSGASPKIEDCVIRDNHSIGGQGGGAMALTSCSPIFRNCTFEANTAHGYGGGLNCAGSSPATVLDCVFTNNSCGTGFGGALAATNLCDVIIRNSWFEGNTSALHGGALGVYESSPYVYDTVFLNNTAVNRGGAVYSYDSDSQYHNCTFVKNGADSDGSIYYEWGGSAPFYARCIFAFSQVSRGSTFFCEPGSTPIVTQSCCYANMEGTEPCGDVTTMLYADPLFCDITTNDLTLASDSPCLPLENPWGQHLGALGEGCVESSVQTKSWGSIKALYR